ncbi:outer membrane biogenesis protein BamB [Stieleria neptunia]|uniref:Outer membrane biogenesis protein BamB n=1 Tax=Stieleria neptunia TaxID=2527979 RepID=A0A518I263_9BACT|nr:PQQ-binding-like beta-propeller repeat protein [Stieleria neptunia]QDV47195.1 outer membrane biogenesis protein BamB [Stieleria neptunia]
MTNESDSSESENIASVVEASPSDAPVATTRSSLRWWPAVVLLAAMFALRMVPWLMESPSLPVMMLAFMGPAGLGIALIFWWCFASRAPLREKAIGSAAVVLIAVVSIALLHFSLRGMFAIVLVIPTGLAAFAIGLVVWSGKPPLRVPIALALAMVTFGYWNLLQNEGTNGSFQPQLLWRWQPTAEQRYLEELAERQPSEPLISDSTPVSLASAPWPAFRGSDRSGVIRGVTLQSDWDSAPPTQIWKQRIGPGWSSFSVAANRLYTQEQRGDMEAVICLDADTGTMIWDFTYPSRFWEAIAGAGPRATPTIADEGIFALGADGILLRLDAVNGKEIWRRDLKQDADRKPPTWGFSASPLVTDSLVIVHAGGAGDKGLFAYDVESGEIVWSVPSGNHSYSSAQLATFDDRRGVLMLSNDGLQFVSVSDGQTIWQHEWKLENYRALQPLVVGPTVYFTTSTQEGTRRLTAARGDNGAWEIADDWTTRDMKSDYNDYVYYDGNLYGFDGGVFACVDGQTGKRHWKRGRYGNGQCLLLDDSGQLLIATERGEVVLVDASPEKLDETAKFQAIEGKTWNHPVLIGSRLYIRNAQEAACYQLAVVAGNAEEILATEDQ